MKKLIMFIFLFVGGIVFCNEIENESTKKFSLSGIFSQKYSDGVSFEDMIKIRLKITPQNADKMIPYYEKNDITVRVVVPLMIGFAFSTTIMIIAFIVYAVLITFEKVEFVFKEI